MTRKILPLLSQGTATNVNLTAGHRIHSVRGEADGKPTYDFLVSVTIWNDTTGAISTTSWKYAGTKNGAPVNLWRDFTMFATKTAAPTASGQIQINVQCGTGVTLQIYTITGVVVV